MKKVDFGGGEANKYPGYEICDILPQGGRVDFNSDKLPYEDDSVDDAVCAHCLEHLENTKNFLNELHRVMKKEAMVKFIVPYGLHPGSSKPVHRQTITECWFDFLRKENSERVYGYKRWGIVGNMIFRKDPQGMIYELEVNLTPIK